MRAGTVHGQVCPSMQPALPLVAHRLHEPAGASPKLPGALAARCAAELQLLLCACSQARGLKRQGKLLAASGNGVT